MHKNTANIQRYHLWEMIGMLQVLKAVLNALLYRL